MLKYFSPVAPNDRRILLFAPAFPDIDAFHSWLGLYNIKKFVRSVTKPQAVNDTCSFAIANLYRPSAIARRTLNVVAFAHQRRAG